MKTILIFSNPFGYGPSGKALSIGKILLKKLKLSRVIICGSEHFLSIVDKEFLIKKVNDRDERSIYRLLKSIPGDKFVISSQNRFAIKAAKKLNISSAFLDGLAWFWPKFPEDHFLADIIFWICYPNIYKKIPKKYSMKINIVGGIVENKTFIPLKKRRGTMFYIGGCKNPLVDLPINYLNLVDKLVQDSFVITNELTIFTDKYSQQHFKCGKKINTLSHANYIKNLAKSRAFITNGGQTSVMEAFSLKTGIGFFLPINLSQMMLVKKIRSFDKNYPALLWNDYINIPKNLRSYSEKKALIFFEKASEKILKDPNIYEKVRNDFIKLISPKNIYIPKLFHNLKTNGAEEIFSILRMKWGLN